MPVDPQRRRVSGLTSAARPIASRNAAKLLNLLRVRGPMGRRALAQELGVTPQTIGNLVEPLLSDGWIRALGPNQTGRGKPGERYDLNPNGTMSIGYEIAMQGVHWVIMDLGGTLRASGHLSVRDTAPEAVLPLLSDTTARLRKRMPAPLAGVGVVAPGPFGPLRRKVGLGSAAAWSGPDPIAALRSALDVPVQLDNDANAAALAEALFGVGSQMRDFLALYFGEGVGLGIVADGRPLRGAFGNAGEIGLLRADSWDGPLDTIASATRLRRGAAGANAVAAWTERVAPPLSRVVAMLEDIFDPECVVVTGDLPDGAADALCAALSDLCDDRRDGPSHRVAGTAGPLTAATGAAALALFDVLGAAPNASEPLPGRAG